MRSAKSHGMTWGVLFALFPSKAGGESAKVAPIVPIHSWCMRKLDVFVRCDELGWQQVIRYSIAGGWRRAWEQAEWTLEVRGRLRV